MIDELFAKLVGWHKCIKFQEPPTAGTKAALMQVRKSTCTVANVSSWRALTYQALFYSCLDELMTVLHTCQLNGHRRPCAVRCKHVNSISIQGVVMAFDCSL